MNETITIHGQEWELKDIEENILWCQKQTWEKIEYSNQKDHEHCFICYWTIQCSCGTKTKAYQNKKNYLCDECFSKFINYKKEKL